MFSFPLESAPQLRLRRVKAMQPFRRSNRSHGMKSCQVSESWTSQDNGRARVKLVESRDDARLDDKYCEALSTMSTPRTQPDSMIVIDFPEELMEVDSNSATFFTLSEAEPFQVPEQVVSSSCSSGSSEEPIPLHRVRADLSILKPKKNCRTKQYSSERTLRTSNRTPSIWNDFKRQVYNIHEDVELLQDDFRDMVLSLFPACQGAECELEGAQQGEEWE